MLRDFARTDWQLGGMCCQILWNFSARITSSNAMFGEAEAQELSDALVDLLGQCLLTSLPAHQFRIMLCFADEDDVFVDCDDDSSMREFALQVWRDDFRPVAKQLLDRVEAHQSDFETLEPPT